jgi:hypothetical protein
VIQVLLVSHLLLWVAVIVEGIIVVALMRQVGTLLLRVGTSSAFEDDRGPLVGDDAPWLPEIGTAGGAGLLVLAFLSTTCGACDLLARALTTVSRGYADRLEVVAVTREGDANSSGWARKVGLRVPVVASPVAFDDYQVSGTPYVYIVGPDRRIKARGGANHLDQLENMVRVCISDATTSEADDSGRTQQEISNAASI